MLIILSTFRLTYFPYIIYYLSPIYVEREVTINIFPKRGITPEQLIGLVCGTTSVFFLVLGVIILAVRKHYENKNQYYDDFEDWTCSSDEVEIRDNIKEKNKENIKEQETVAIDDENL